MRKTLQAESLVERRMRGWRISCMGLVAGSSPIPGSRGHGGDCYEECRLRIRRVFVLGRDHRLLAGPHARCHNSAPVLGHRPDNAALHDLLGLPHGDAERDALRSESDKPLGCLPHLRQM